MHGKSSSPVGNAIWKHKSKYSQRTDAPSYTNNAFFPRKENCLENVHVYWAWERSISINPWESTLVGWVNDFPFGRSIFHRGCSALSGSLWHQTNTIGEVQRWRWMIPRVGERKSEGPIFEILWILYGSFSVSCLLTALQWAWNQRERKERAVGHWMRWRPHSQECTLLENWNTRPSMRDLCRPEWFPCPAYGRPVAALTLVHIWAAVEPT